MDWSPPRSAKCAKQSQGPATLVHLSTELFWGWGYLPSSSAHSSGAECSSRLLLVRRNGESRTVRHSG